MADRFEDPRIEGEVRRLRGELESLVKGAEEAVANTERRAREAEQRTKAEPRRPGRAAEPTLDQQYERRSAEVTGDAEARAKATDAEARAKQRVAKAEADATRSARERDRFEARRLGRRSAEIYDTQRQATVGRAFRGGGDQAEALRRAQAQADVYNRAARAAAPPPGRALIPHPELFGRRPFETIRPAAYELPRRPAGEAGRAARPAGGIAASEQALSRAELNYARARQEYASIVRRKTSTEADVTAARQAQQTARQEVAAGRRNVAATREQVVARQREVALLRAADPPEVAARQQLLAALRQEALSRVQIAERAVATQGPLALGPGPPITAATAAREAQLRAAAQARRAAQPSVPQLALPPGPTPGRASDLLAEAKRREAGGRLGGAAAATAQTAAATKNATSAQAAYREGVAETARQESLLSNELQRRGALTTEFISAAGRGTTTIHEMGVQVGQTVAKFAGWTAAATAVFGVVAAIGQLGTGALESLNGVNNLQRIIQGLNTDDAQGALIDLSRRFNLPIKDVSDAAYGMSKILGQAANPAEALKNTLAGTEAVLYAVKIGEVDAATATRYFTAIVGGFNLNAKQMPLLLDTINAAQNKFGGNFAQLAEGIGQAGGQFKNAGSNYRELTTLLQVGARVTGRTPKEIGTALRRSAEIYRRPERRQTIMELLGVDPRDTSIYDVIKRAQEVAARSSPSRRSEIAKAISTPELASGRILPIINARELTKVVEAGLQRDKVKDSAKRELATALKAPSEQIARLKNDIQGLGADLARSGFLKPFTLLLKILDKTLNVMHDITAAAGELFPDQVTTAAAFALPAAAAVGAARRFDVGGRAPEGSLRRGVLGRAPGAARRAQLLTGIAAEEQTIIDKRIQLGTERRTALGRAARAEAQLAGVTGTDAAAEEKRVALKAKMNAQEELAAAAEAEMAILSEQNAVLTRQRAAVLRTRFRSEAAVMEAYTAAGGVYTADTLSRRDPLAKVRRVEPGVTPGGVILPGGGGRAAAAGTTEAAAGAERLAAEEAGMVAGARRFETSATRVGGTGRLVGAGSVAAAKAATGTGGVLRATGAGIARLATGLAAFLGPLDYILVGGFAFYELYSHLREHGRKVDAAVARSRRARTEGRGPAELRRAREQLLEQYPAADEPIQRAATGPFSQRYRGPGARYGPRQRDATREQREYQANVAEQSRVDEAQQRGRGLFLGQIAANLRRRYGAARTTRQKQAALDQAQREYDRSLFVTDPRRQRDPAQAAKAGEIRDAMNARQARLAAVARGVSAEDAVVKTLEGKSGVENLIAALQRTAILAGAPGGALRASELRRAGLGLGHLRAKLADAGPGQTQKALQDYQTLRDAAISDIMQNYQNLLNAAKTPAQRTAARAEARAKLQNVIRGERAEIRALARRKVQLARDIAFAGRLVDLATASLREVANQNIGELIRDAPRLTKDPRKAKPPPTSKDAKADVRRARQIRKALAGDQAAFNQLFGEIDDQYNAANEEAARDQNKNAKSAQDAAQKRQQALQNAIQLFQARQGLASARALVGASQSAQLQRALSDAQAFYSFLRSQRGVGRLDLIQAQTAIFQARDALAQYARQQAQDLVRARGELAKSRTADPIKQAEVELRTATQLLRYAQTPAERIQGLADINNRRRELAQTRLSERADSEQFLFDIGKISRDQYMSWIENFLRGHKTLRRTQRELFRQLQRTLHQMRQETEQDLDLQVGEIRLPTLYDVRRIIRQGTRTAPGGVMNQSNHFTINGATDQDAVYQTVESAVSNGGRSAMRAAGLSG